MPEHEHHHSHGGKSIHCGEGLNCADCGNDHAFAKKELIALMRYMVDHNTAHTQELAELAGKIGAMGEPGAYEQIMQVVYDFEQSNLRLAAVLAALDA